MITGLLLLVAAFASWTLSGRIRDRISSEERRLTLQEHTDYWAGKYELLSQQSSGANPESLVWAANGAFRRAMRDSGGAPSVERLDDVLQAYTSALKNGADSAWRRDAAFNFEYVSRLRDALATSPRRPASTSSSSKPPATRDDLPGGPTIHGRRGAHPPDTRGEDFEVLTPMDYGEREAQPEPTPGRPFPRKG
jgi:hypothetical protein